MTIPILLHMLQGLMCYAVVMGFMFALSDLPEVTVAIAQPLVPALALGMSAVLGIEMLSYVSLGGILVSVAGENPLTSHLAVYWSKDIATMQFHCVFTSEAQRLVVAAVQQVLAYHSVVSFFLERHYVASYLDLQMTDSVCCSGAIAFVAFNAAGSGGQEGHAFGYAALVLELLAYAAQMVYLPNLSKRYKPLTLTAMYYTVATAASAATLILRDKDDLWSVCSHSLLQP